MEGSWETVFDLNVDFPLKFKASVGLLSLSSYGCDLVRIGDFYTVCNHVNLQHACIV